MDIIVCLVLYGCYLVHSVLYFRLSNVQIVDKPGQVAGGGSALKFCKVDSTKVYRMVPSSRAVQA